MWSGIMAGAFGFWLSFSLAQFGGIYWYQKRWWVIVVPTIILASIAAAV